MQDKFCKIMNVPDPGMVSRGAMQAAIVRLGEAVEMLTTELFCENPQHQVFEKLTEAEIAQMRIERIRRMGGKP